MNGLLVETASDWTDQSVADRLRSSAAALRSHDFISKDEWQRIHRAIQKSVDNELGQRAAEK